MSYYNYQRSLSPGQLGKLEQYYHHHQYPNCCTSSGEIHSVGFEQSQNQNYWQNWQLQELIDVDKPELYFMRHDTAVLAYADEDSPLYSSFRLPMELVPSPVNKSARQNCKEYVWMDLMSWIVRKDDTAGRIIAPIPYTGESKEPSVKITYEELAGVMDDNGDIHFSKVLYFCLPHFDCDVRDIGAAGTARPPLNIYCPRDPENPVSPSPYLLPLRY